MENIILQPNEIAIHKFTEQKEWKGTIYGFVVETGDIRWQNHIIDNNRVLWFPEFLYQYFKHNNILDVAVIDSLYVSNAYQGHGLGKQLIKEFKERVPNCDVILLYAGIKESQKKDFDLITFYNRQGFEAIKVGLGLDTVLMLCDNKNIGLIDNIEEEFRQYKKENSKKIKKRLA